MPQQSREKGNNEGRGTMKPKQKTLALGKSHAKQSMSAKLVTMLPERLYIRDDTYGWLPAVVLERDDEHSRVKVRIDLPSDWLETTLARKTDFYGLHQKKKWIPRDDAVPASFWPNHPASSNALARDVSTLEPLNEASALHLLKQRCKNGLYYTRMGHVMIAMNLMTTDRSKQFSPELRRTYASSFVWQVDESSDASLDGTPLDIAGILEEEESSPSPSSSHAHLYERLDLEPHLYEVSATAYRRLVLQNEPQSILVGGISGSGKTETVHRLIEHLVTMDAWSTNDMTVTMAHGKIHQAMLDHVLQSLKVLRAFGSAATPLQPNSTRCGIVTKLHFALHNHGLYGLAGCKTEMHLLEASRVVNREPGGHNFHIFYHLLALPADDKCRLLGSEWRDATPSDFAILQSTSPIPEVVFADEAKQLLDVLEGFQCSTLHLPHLIQAVGIVLLLGNLAFEPDEERGQGALVAQGKDLNQLSLLMGVESSVIASCLTTATSSSHCESISTRMSPAAACAGRDALVRTIYRCVVDSVLRAINTHTASALQDDHRYGLVSIMDAFGWEQMKVNRFEQLVANVTSETLHRKLRMEHWSSLTSEYRGEGIEILSYIPCRELDPLDVSEEICGFINEILSGDGAGRSNAETSAEADRGVKSLYTVDMSCKFSMKHFLGPIEYDASNFQQRSTVVPSNLLQLAAKSSNSIIAAECCDLVSSGGLSSSSLTTNHTDLKFVRKSLGSLLESSSNCQMQLIWCIQPSVVKESCIVDHQSTLRQLQGADISTAVSFAAKRFQSKLALYEVTGRFNCLLGAKQKLAVSSMEPCDGAHFVLSTLLAQMVHEVPSTSVPFVCGSRKVYFQRGVLQVLEQRRRSLLESKARVIQNVARRTEAQTHRRQSLLGVVRIQSQVRCHLASSLYRQRRKSATRIQAIVRGASQRARVDCMVKARMTLNFALLRYCARRRQALNERSATAIATWYRSHRDAIRYAEILFYVTKIQSKARTWRAQRSYLQNIRALAILTRFFSAALSTLARTRQERAASQLSKWYRSNSARLKFMITRDAVVMIQAKVRSSAATSTFRKKVRSAIILGRFYHRLRNKWRHQREEKAATIISAWHRSVMVKRAYSLQLYSVTVLQALIRGTKARSDWNNHRSAATCIARFCSAFCISRRRFFQFSHAATSIAARYRGTRVRKQYLLCRRGVTIVQSLVRRNMHKRMCLEKVAAAREIVRACKARLPRILSRRRAATKIAAWFKSIRLSCQFQRTIHSITRCQGAMRQFIAKRQRQRHQDSRRAFELESTSASIIAAWYRYTIQARTYRSLRGAVVTFQAAWRAMRVRDEFLIMKGATLYLESWFLRCVAPQIQWNKENAAIILQAWTRRRQGIAQYVRVKEAASLLQASVRRRMLNVQDVCASAEVDPTSSVDCMRSDDVTQGTKHDSNQSSLAERLHSEIEEYKYCIAVLKSEVQQVTEFATLHAQEIETEYEEKLAVYEDEVLTLKQKIALFAKENTELKSALQDAQKAYEKNVRRMQKGMQKTQTDHRDYLDKIMMLLDDTELARKTETDRIREELEEMKRERDARIASLKEEVHLLRSIGISPKQGGQRFPPGSLAQGARKLVQKLKAALSPENILLIAKEALEHPGAAERYVEAKLSNQALKNISYLEEMTQIADFEASKQAEINREAKQHLGEVEVQLTRAYLQNGQIQTKVRRRKDFLE